MIKSASMKASGIMAILSLALLFNSCSQQQEAPKLSAQYHKEQHEAFGPKKEHEEGIKEAMLWMSQMRVNPATGLLDINDVIKARRQAMHMRNNAANKQQTLGLKWESLGPDNVGGRTRALLIDKNNSNRLIAGSVTGGLFVSNDGALNWTEHPDNSKFLSTSISSIIQSSNGDVYVGTGETFVFTQQNTDGHIGGGIYKSVDNGVSFNLLSSTEPAPNNANSTWSYVSKLAADPYDPNKIYAASNGGLYYTLDGGSNWIAAQGIAPADAGRESRDVKVNSDGIVFAEINRKYYRSTDGATFTLISGTNGFPATNVNRIEFGVAPQDPNYVYAAICNSSNGLRGIYKSIDAGISWVPYSQENSSVFNPLGQQGSYNISFAVSPSNKNEVVIGGQLEMWKGGLDVGWDLVAYWIPETPNNPYYIHADMHFAVYDQNNPDILYVCSDGGISKSTNASQQFPTFTPRNKNYVTTQFYDIAASPSGEVMAGAQDNGTIYIDYLGNTIATGTDLRGGDGGYCVISRLEPNVIFSEVQYGAVSRSLNRGDGFGSVWDSYATSLGMGSEGSSQFIAPYDMWEEQVSVIDSIVVDSVTSIADTFRSVDNKGYMIFGANSRIMITPDALDAGGIYWYSRTVAGAVSAVSPTSDGDFYIGTTSGNLYIVTGLRTATYDRPTNTVTGITVRQLRSGSQWPGTTNARYISSIGVDPKNAAHIVVTFGGYGLPNNVFVSNDALASTPVFTSAQGDLPNMPVYSSVIDFYDPNNLIVGTDFGVWSSSNGGTNWIQEVDGGLYNTPIYSLKQRGLYNEDCYVLYVASYGRGMFRSTTLTEKNNSTCNLVSSILPTKPKAAVNTTVSLYPNPASNNLNVNLNLNKAGKVTVHIVDIMGREVYSQQFGNKSVGQSLLTADVSQLPSGTYIVAIETPTGVITRQFVVSK